MNSENNSSSNINESPDNKCVDYEYPILCSSPGKTNITIKTFSGKSATSSIKVVDNYVKVSSLSINSGISNRNRQIGETFKLPVTITPSNATNKKVYWQSSNTKAFTVDKDGNVKAVGKGRAKITATVYYDDVNYKKDTVEYNAYAKVSDLTVNDKVWFERLSGSCTAGKTKTIGLNVNQDGLKSIKSLDTNIATISKVVTQYKCVGCFSYKITCKKAGKTTIEAVTNAGGKASYALTVK